MNEKMARLTLAIASLGLEDRELKELLQQLQRISIGELVAHVGALRRLSSAAVIDKLDLESTPTRFNRTSRDATVGQRVERLLKQEAQLTTAMAFEELSEMLVKTGQIEARDLPPLSKKAFWLWADRVVQRVPEKEVLRCATMIRNKYVHRPSADWTLRTRTE